MAIYASNLFAAAGLVIASRIARLPLPSTPSTTCGFQRVDARHTGRVRRTEAFLYHNVTTENAAN
jgi:hypothetical protein